MSYSDYVQAAKIGKKDYQSKLMPLSFKALL